MALSHQLKIYIALIQIDSAYITTIIVNVLLNNSYLGIGKFLPEGVSCLRAVGLITFWSIDAIQTNDLAFALRVYDSQCVSLYCGGYRSISRKWLFILVFVVCS